MSTTQDYERNRTTNSAWYLALPWMEKFLKKIPTRSYFQELLRKYCEARGITRLSMGLVTGARASMYFDGSWHSVSFDAIHSLAENGTDILFIEKADIAEVLTPYAKKYGVALVNTIGFLTEYAKDLMKAAKRSGANVAMLTDYEDYGLSIVAKAMEEATIPRIGIDEETFRRFGLDRDRLSVSSKRRLKNFNYLNYFEHLDKDFLRTRRVEIDAVLAAVGNERFWEYIMEKLIELSPTRDYNRAISMPANETLYHKTLQDFLVYVSWYVGKSVKDEETKIQDELENVAGMIDVDEKKKEIQTRLQNKVYADDEGMKLMVSKVDEILKALPKMEDDSDDNT
jgi:hypothetical protein